MKSSNFGDPKQQDLFEINHSIDKDNNNKKKSYLQISVSLWFPKFNKITGLNHLSHFIGFDLGERFSLRRAFCEGDKTCFKLGSAFLIRDTM